MTASKGADCYQRAYGFQRSRCSITDVFNGIQLESIVGLVVSIIQVLRGVSITSPTIVPRFA